MGLYKIHTHKSHTFPCILRKVDLQSILAFTVIRKKVQIISFILVIHECMREGVVLIGDFYFEVQQLIF